MFDYEYDETSRYQIGDVITFEISNVFGELNEFMSIDYTIKGTIVDIIDEGMYAVQVGIKYQTFNPATIEQTFYVANQDVKRVIKPKFIDGRLNNE